MALSTQRPRLGAGAAAISLLLLACGEGTGVSTDSGLDKDGSGRDVDVAADTEGDAVDVGGREPDESAEPDPGPVTLVVTQFEVLLDRVCDHDADGTLDNSIADLGSPGASLLAVALTTTVQGRIEENLRFIFHIPLVEDRGPPVDPDVVLIAFRGEDTDPDRNREDDFSGEEPFYVPPGGLDPCGEPTCAFEDCRVEPGLFAGEGGVIPLPLTDGAPVIARNASFDGTLAPGGASFETTVCAYALVGEVGGTEDPLSGGTVLELFLAGGRIFGIPSVPGISPDVDVDGDGLERIILDEEGRVSSCVDGDLTAIAGADCWQDPRMADGFSLLFRVTGVSARFAGREPRWEQNVEGTCEEPPERSLFDPR